MAAVLAGSLTAAVFLGCANISRQQRQEVLAAQETYSGFFAFNWESWKVNGALADSSWQSHNVEEGVWLTLTPLGSPPGEHWFVVRPAPGERASSFGDVRWSWAKPDHITVEWSASLAGIRLELLPKVRQGGTITMLEGVAHWWSTDTKIPDGLEAKVSAKERGC